MTRPFVRMNGAGNDFVVVNALETPFAPTAEQARAIADRRFYILTHPEYNDYIRSRFEAILDGRAPSGQGGGCVRR